MHLSTFTERIEVVSTIDVSAIEYRCSTITEPKIFVFLENILHIIRCWLKVEPVYRVYCPRPHVLDKSNLSYGSHSSFQMITNPKIFMVLAETTKIVKFVRLVFISR
jgi:hypothetical protein